SPAELGAVAGEVGEVEGAALGAGVLVAAHQLFEQVSGGLVLLGGVAVVGLTPAAQQGRKQVIGHRRPPRGKRRLAGGCRWGKTGLRSAEERNGWRAGSVRARNGFLRSRTFPARHRPDVTAFRARGAVASPPAAEADGRSVAARSAPCRP